MKPVTLPKNFTLPKRYFEASYIEYMEEVSSILNLSNSSEDQEILENEVKIFATSEWIQITRQLRELVLEFSLSHEQHKLAMRMVTDRHKKAWGPTGI